MPDVRFYPFVDGSSMSQSVVTPFKHHAVGSIRGNVRWDFDIPVGAKGLTFLAKRSRCSLDVFGRGAVWERGCRDVGFNISLPKVY